MVKVDTYRLEGRLQFELDDTEELRLVKKKNAVWSVSGRFGNREGSHEEKKGH